MKRITIVSLFAAVLLAAPAFALPGLDISVGPCLGLYTPSLKTLNSGVLDSAKQPAFGSVTPYGLDVNIGLPMGLNFGVGFSYWSKTASWRVDNSSPGNPNIHDYAWKVSAPTASLRAHYAMPIVPMVLKAKFGAQADMIWGTVKRTEDYTHITSSGLQAIDRFYWTGKGSGTCFGLLAGLDLVAIPKITIGADAAYSFGSIASLEIRESSDTTKIGAAMFYLDKHDVAHDLPIELGGFSARMYVRYHF